ncbi:hypothetical protein C8R47DRAFT_1229526 [Mycena vitilis]|nr:hypothetical protein C8R47DRAFT_1229526 [Mycena vitilis]
MPSTTNHRFVAIGIHKLPAHSSLPEFRAKMETFAHALATLPAAQEHCLKYELIIPNDKLDSYNETLDCPPPRPVILVKLECENQNHCAQLFKDFEVTNLISGAAEFGDISLSSTDELTKIDHGSSAADATTWVGIYNRPTNQSTGQFYTTLKEFVEMFVTLPVVQRNLLKYTVSFHNDAMAGDLQSLDVSSAEPFVVIMFNGTWDGMVEIALHEEVRQFTNKMRDVNLSTKLNCFSADILTKLGNN